MNDRELIEKLLDAINTRFARRGECVRCPTLKTMAMFIKNRLGYEVTVESSWSSTDRPMGRLRHPGKGRSGNKLSVYKPGGDTPPIFEHDSSQTYRHNTEVAEWILDQLKKRP